MSRDDTAARRFLLALLIGALALVGFISWPLAEALFLAAVLAVVLDPLQRRLARALGGRPRIAAVILTIGVLALVVGPVLWLAAVAVREATGGVRFLFETFRSGGMSALLERLPAPLADYAGRLVDYLGDLGSLAEAQLQKHGANAASAVGSALTATGVLLFQLAMMLIALFFLLVSGRELVAWVDRASPLRRGQTEELLAECRKVSYSVFLSAVLTAAAQTAVAVVGYLIASVPQVFFFTAVTFVLALIPTIGAGAVCVVAALVLLTTGHPYMAGFLALWGLVVVSLTDNIVKPYLIKGDVQMHGAVVFFALIGGIAAFGMIGLLIGPLAVALFLTLLRMYRRDYLGAR